MSEIRRILYQIVIGEYDVDSQLAQLFIWQANNEVTR
jgi:hypothetical protein